MKILVDSALWNNPKLFRLADLLGRNPTEAGGYLARLWSWTADYRPGGSLEGLSDKEVAQAAGWRGPAGKLVSALRKSGWLDHVQVHEWQGHQGKYIEKIMAERARKLRAYQARRLHGDSAESPSENATPVSRSVSVSVSRIPYPVPVPTENGETAPVTRGDSAASLLASTYIRMNPGTISQAKATQLVDFALARGVKAVDLESAFMDPKSKGLKIWEVMDPLTQKKNGTPSLLEQIRAKFRSEGLIP